MYEHLAFFDITSWSYAIGGEHYTARVKCNGEYGVEVEAPLTATQAKELNKKDGVTFYEKGTLSNRFWTEASATGAAVRTCRERWPHIRAVIENDHAQPHYVAWCSDEDIRHVLNDLYYEMEELYEETYDPWSRWPDQMQELCDQWDILLEELTDG